jgi:hypothetical protein
MFFGIICGSGRADTFYHPSHLDILWRNKNALSFEQGAISFKRFYSTARRGLNLYPYTRYAPHQDDYRDELTGIYRVFVSRRGRQ